MSQCQSNNAVAMALRCFVICRVSSSSSSTPASSRGLEGPREMMLKDFTQVALPIPLVHERLSQAMVACQQRKCKHL